MKKLYILALCGLFLPFTAGAHLPTIEKAGSPFIEVPEAEALADPTVQSLAVYGILEESDEVDVYTFTVTSDARIPFEVLVPKKKRLSNYRPYMAVYGKEFPAIDSYMPPWSAPEGYVADVIIPPEGEREVFNEPFSQEMYFSQTEQMLDVKAGERYFISVFEPSGGKGEYVLGVGQVENFENANFNILLKDVVKLKLNLVGGREIPWRDILSLFLMMAGFIIGLGAVTVIDLHGFMGRKSGYWTEATTRTHKITKPLIWLGTGLAALGGAMTYWETGLSGTAFFHAILLVLLVLNGLFLTFAVSPMLLKKEEAGKAKELLSSGWQKAIAVSFVVSFAGWWTSAFLFIWYLVMVR